MTVSEVLGRGEQKGIKLQYRGGTMEVDRLPELKIEMYITDKNVGSVMKIICDAARTGKFGDGRIFVTPVEKSGGVRTGDADICDSDIKETAATGEPSEDKETPLIKT
jgi:nitrogen regulatory protein P-II 1